MRQDHQNTCLRFQAQEVEYRKRISHLIAEFSQLEHFVMCNSEADELREVKSVLEAKLRETEMTVRQAELALINIKKEKEVLRGENDTLD